MIERLSNDLKDYGKGYSITNLKYMSRLASEFNPFEFSQQPADQIPWFSLIEILQQPATQIPWYTLCEIIIKSKSNEEMLWYIKETHKNGWSRSMVLNQIAMKAYE